MKDEIRPIYCELQGYLSQAPPIGEHGNATTTDDTLWNQFNAAVEELNKITSKDFNKFKVAGIKMGQFSTPYINVSNYRQKLSGLISHLHGEYFSDEQPPFSGMPSTIITQQQAQSQNTYVQILLDIQSKIDEKLKNCEEGSKEKTFLEKIKSSLSKVGNITELFALILKTGMGIGLTIEQIWKLFS